tara:strand:+ start:163231 stop:164334 length:1104 start_codon:yes stop_codon:yes gene_type:complete
MDKSKIGNLPLMKHFEGNQIKESVDSFRKGEKGLFFFVKIAALIAVGYLLWIYVLPPLFIAIGKLIAVISTVAIVGIFIAFIPVMLKALRRFTRFVHKSLIKHAPFEELYEQRDKLDGNTLNFNKAQGTVKNLKSQMEIGAAEAEEKAISYQEKILSYKKKATKLKNKLDDAVTKRGVAAKGEDEYVNDSADLMKVLSHAERMGHMLEQEKDFVVKYGVRAATMKKLTQKLVMVGTALEIKVLDFDATIEILEKDYAYAKASKEATTMAKNSLTFTEGWEVEYALDVVTSTIAQDIAITSANFASIDMLTTNYSMDSDELYDKLNLLADNIDTGKDVVPSAKSYNREDFKPTHDDRVKSGGFGENIF